MGIVEQVLMWVMGILQTLDVITSRIAFMHGAVELNPVLGFGTRPDVFTLLVAKLVFMVLFYFLVKRTKRIFIPIGICVLFLVVVVNNLVIWMV